MKIIIAPAKTIDDKNDFAYHLATKPLFLKKAKVLYDYLLELDKETISDIYRCSSKLVDKTYDDLRRYDINDGFIHALFAFRGIQYQTMAPSVLDEEALAYLNDHLYILSGLYGALRPFDMIVPYRLEMGFDLKGFKEPNLYRYWQEVNDIFKDELIIDLASKEYSDLITSPRRITVTFINGQKVKATYAKMARGAFVRYLASNKIEDIKDMENFCDLGYHLDKESSSEKTLVFRGE